MAFKKFACPEAKRGKVDGLVVGHDVPNLGSIKASLDSYKILPGIRRVPLACFNTKGKFYSPSEEIRAATLAEQIKLSGEINPLIVVYEGPCQQDQDSGPYILEGGHRFDALIVLGKKFFPAVVVLDLSSLSSNEAARFLRV